MIPKYYQYVTLSDPILLGTQGFLTHSALEKAVVSQPHQLATGGEMALSFFPSAGVYAFSSLTTGSKPPLTTLLLGLYTS